MSLHNVVSLRFTLLNRGQPGAASVLFLFYAVILACIAKGLFEIVNFAGVETQTGNAKVLAKRIVPAHWEWQTRGRYLTRYLDLIESADRTSPTGFDVKTVRLYEKMARLRQQMHELNQIKKQLKKQPDKQLSMTDPDARSMATSGRGSGIVGDNVQAAVDTKHHLIVGHEVTNVGNDHGQLSRIALSAKDAVVKPKLKVVADRGYFSGPEIRACDLNKISAYVPKPLTSASRKKGLFTKADFIFESSNDVNRCPAGERAIHRFNTVEHEMTLRVYWPSACPRRPLKERCSPSDYRRIRRWEHEKKLKPCSAGLTGSPMR
ncbi:hypothetical protein OKW46_002588 [Paraburkholderia sp. WSM4179]|nr:hypothetical protein [Paraburkholderia sp. WSM4179]